MKKLMSFLLAMLMILSLTACGGMSRRAIEETLTDAKVTPEFQEFKWPKSEIAGLLPVPKSNIGKIAWEASYGFVIDVGETTKSEYDAYVDECWDNGFTVDYDKGDNHFYANNKGGYHLSIRFEENDVMWIRIDEPDDVGETVETAEPVQTNAVAPTPTPTATPTPTTAAPSSTSTSDWRQFLKDYEKFMDEYIAVLKKYMKNPLDMSVLSDYTTMMTELSEWDEKYDDMSDDLDNPAELAEFLQEWTRIYTKMITAMYE